MSLTRVPDRSHAGRVTLVPLNRSHLARTQAWANDPELMRLMDRARPVTDPEHEAWFETLAHRRDCAYFAVEILRLEGGTQANGPWHVGNVWLWAVDERHRKAELRIVIGERDARGRGVGTEAIDGLCDLAFEQRGLHRVYAYVLANNPRARRSFERAGFAVEGTLRDDRWTGEQFVDTYLLARIRRP